MVVLQLGPYPPPHGGVQTNIVAIRQHLRRHGIGAPVINLTRHRDARDEEVYHPRSAVEVARLLASIRADVIHVHIGGRLTPRLLALCLFCTVLPGRRTVLTFHSGGYPSWQRGRRSPGLWITGRILRRLDAVLAVNTEIAALFQGLGVSPSRLRVMCPFTPVAVDHQVTVPVAVQKFSDEHSLLLSTVGLLEPEYDLATQITTFGRIRDEFPDAGLVIIGSGSLEADLKALIARQPWAEHILLCGDVQHEATLKVIARSDAFLRTTLYDGDSISVREALQLDVPVVATDNGMRPDGVNLIPASDPEALYRTVCDVLRRPRVRRSVAAGDSHEMDALLALYRRLANREEVLQQVHAPTVL